MALKYRSKNDYSLIYSGDRGGMNLGLDGAIYLRQEATPRVFNPPRPGTQGKSTGAVSAVTDLSAVADTNFRASINSGAVVSVTLVNTGLTSGPLIAAALESKINTALAAAGQDHRVWVNFNGAGPDQYIIYSQSTGDESAVVITDGLTANVADQLKIGIANGGTEVVGTDDTDFLLYTTGGPTYSQAIESNQHRSGRYHTGVVKAKKMAEWNCTTYLNMSGTAGASLDPAVRLLWKGLLGSEEVIAGVAIRYRQAQPNTYMSFVRVSTIFGEYYTGAYVRDMTMNVPGDAPVTLEWSGKAARRVIAGLAKVLGAVSASVDLVVQDGETERYDVGAPVMLVDVDGRTILYGIDGTLTVATLTPGSDGIGLSAAVTVPDGAYLVPWNPGAVQQTGRDNIYTDLYGSFKLRASRPKIDTTNIQLTFTNDHNDLDGYFGRDANAGFVPGNRLTIALSVTFDLSGENFSEVVQSQTFAGFNPELIIGETIGRYCKITGPKWIPAVPPIELPENGTTPVTLEGNLYQSAPGQQDPILVEFP